MEDSCEVKSSFSIVRSEDLAYGDLKHDFSFEVVLTMEVDVSSSGALVLKKLYHHRLHDEVGFIRSGCAQVLFPKRYSSENSTRTMSSCDLFNIALDSSRFGWLLFLHKQVIAAHDPILGAEIEFANFFCYAGDQSRDLLPVKPTQWQMDANFCFESLLNLSITDYFRIFSCPEFDSTSWDFFEDSRKIFLDQVTSVKESTDIGFRYLHASIQITFSGPLFKFLKEKFKDKVHFSTQCYRLKFYGSPLGSLCFLFSNEHVFALSPFSSASSFAKMVQDAAIASFSVGDNDTSDSSFLID